MRSGKQVTGVEILAVDVINLDRVVEYIQPELPGVTCYVEQTGGGCATIYLGDTYDITEKHGVVVPWPPEYALGEFRCVLAGPGWFERAVFSEGRADPSEFSIGYDQDLQDHPNYSIDGWDVDGHDERIIARRMVQLYLEHPHVKAGLIR